MQQEAKTPPDAHVHTLCETQHRMAAAVTTEGSK